MTYTPTVVITVSGGVASVQESHGVTVLIVDYDNLKDTTDIEDLDPEEIDWLEANDLEFLQKQFPGAYPKE